MNTIKQFVYPVVFIKEENEVVAMFPDLDISIDGVSFEEAFLFAKDYLRKYFIYALKYDIEFNLPTNFEEIEANNKGKHIMLVDALVFNDDLKMKI